ncbi:MAG: response regulator transcription factor, partial [Rhodospirillaceae bacterium]|nr:response regulator transcription factor [Rhodospirillaceae bacterium]
MKILLVDDETLTREALAMLLRHAGREDYGPQAQVLEAASADEGLAVLDRHREKPPNLILLDFFLPDGTGGEVVGRFVAAAPTTPVVVISSANDGKDAAAVLSCGAVGYLPKSASFACLRQLVTLARSGDLRHQFALFGREGVASMPQVQGGASAAGASAAGAVPLTARQ